MHKLKAFTHALLLVTTPSLLVYPQDTSLQTTLRQVHLKEKKTEISHTLSYDEIIHLLDELESGELEKKCSYEDLEKINHLLAFLAKEGMLPDDSELLDDFEELLDGKDNLYKYAFSAQAEKIVIPVIFNDYGEAVLCKGWVQKKWKQTKKSVKKHKRAIIIGAAIAVAAAIVIGVIVATSAGAAAASAAGAAGSAAASDKQKEDPPVVVPNAPPAMEDSTLKAAMDEQILSFKEHIYTEQLFPSSSPSIPHQELSWEETGEILGHVFAKESYYKLKELEYQNPFTPQKEDGNTVFGHPEIDYKFSSCAKKTDDFSTPFYWMRGERALDHGYLTQAVQDLGKAIEGNPANPLPYLERGFAHFGLGEYDRSLEDYRTYISQKPPPLSIPEFGLGFAKALPKGIYDSGKGLFFFLSDLVRHPVHTGEQMWGAFTLLSDLVRSEQWGALSEIVAPEVHQLVKEWDSLPSDTRGELAGYAFGKYGSDILIPAALAKAISKGLKGAQELGAVYKGLQTAEKTLLLESAASLESGAKIAEIVQLEKQISSWLGENTQLIRNGAGDPIFLSKDGIRKVRFDFNRPFPHESPHLHFEHFVDGEWKEINRVYPSNVPHK